ncbi:MAG: class II glutamine amidotransferase [Planctomycetota bacterium]|jgi:glutamine amidotransferase
MCRLYGFRANESTKVECSLVLAQNALLHQSREDLRGKSHADGWGIAYYEGGRPVVEKRATAAFDTVHFSTAAERVFARTVLAHVRRATVSQPSFNNAHPFVYGPWAFAHNGTVQAFDRVAPQLEMEISDALLAHRQGSTDSELAFLWILERMAQRGMSPLEPCSDLDALASLLGESVRRLAKMSDNLGVERPSELNFILTDGRIMLASRWINTLYWTFRDGIHDCEVCGIPHIEHDSSRSYRAVVIASEPISHEDWQEVPHGGIVAVDAEGHGRLHGAAVSRDSSR